MAKYTTDEREAAQDDLDNVGVMLEVVELFKASLRFRATKLNKNSELVKEMCQHIDEAAHDTIKSIIALAKDAGAVQISPKISTSQAA